jgi:hypothetical protein
MVDDRDVPVNVRSRSLRVRCGDGGIDGLSPPERFGGGQRPVTIGGSAP